MKEKILSAINDIITVSDNKTKCCTRIMGWVTFIVGSIMICYNSIAHGIAFDYKEFCTGSSELMAAVGAAIMMKKNDEPDQ